MPGFASNSYVSLQQMPEQPTVTAKPKEPYSHPIRARHTVELRTMVRHARVLPRPVPDERIYVRLEYRHHLVPDSSFPFPHLWTGTSFLLGGLTDGKDAIDVLEQPGDRYQDLPRQLSQLQRHELARFRLGDRTRLLPLLWVGRRQCRRFGP